MGANLARNIAAHRIPVSVHNRTASRTARFIERFGDQGPIVGRDRIDAWVSSVAKPRILISIVQAGEATDEVIAQVAPHLDAGDVLIDGGNAHFRDTQRRHATLAERSVHFLGVGISGGEEGALTGPSIMPGGDLEPYERLVAPIFETIAAEVDGTPCCAYIGPDGAGHYVKMVHNGIEYADMQLIAETYDLLRSGAGLEVEEIASRFERWNETELESFLIRIAAQVLSKRDEATGEPLVDVILDAAEQKGTGRWSAEDALELGVPLTAITEAVFARSLSALVSQRQIAASRLAGPPPADAHLSAQPEEAHHSRSRAPLATERAHSRLRLSSPDAQQLAEDLKQALYAAKIVAYAQGFAQLQAASEAEGWGLQLGVPARIWRGGCIIRARFLDRIVEAYDEPKQPENLMLSSFFADALQQAQGPWRRVVSAAAQLGIPAPAFSSTLAYYDGFRRARGPAALIQGLRDLFGAHTYRRIDREGTFHTSWSGDGSEVQV